MSYKEIVERHVRQRLEDSFGKALATLIIMSASNAANMPIIDPSRDDFMRFVDAVARDQRVVDMWGVAGASGAAEAWRQMA